MHFLTSIFFLIFCFLPTYTFDFNKLGLKWKLITTAYTIEEKNPILISKTWNFRKKCIFLHEIFSELEPKVKYFKKFSSDFNKQGLKWKLVVLLLILMEKMNFFNFDEHGKTNWKTFGKGESTPKFLWNLGLNIFLWI